MNKAILLFFYDYCWRNFWIFTFITRWRQRRKVDEVLRQMERILPKKSQKLKVKIFSYIYFFFAKSIFQIFLRFYVAKVICYKNMYCFDIIDLKDPYIDGSRAVYHISLSSRGSQMNRWRFIDGVSVYLQDQKRILKIKAWYKKVQNTVSKYPLKNYLVVKVF